MKHLSALFILCLLSCGQSKVQDDLRLWYDRPAAYFEESLVLGNGKLGATVFGGIEVDSIYLNDATLWAGEPVDPYMNPDAHEHIPAIRRALFNEDYRTADSLNRFVQGSFSESFAPLGTMKFTYDHVNSPTNYYRELDLETARAKVTYQANGIDYSREYFVSHPDQVFVIHLKASEKRALNFSLDFSSLLMHSIRGRDKQLEVQGNAPYHAEPGYRGDMPDAVVFDPERGTRFNSVFKIQDTDGNVKVSDTALSLSEGSFATILVSIGTSFNGFDKNPSKDGKDERKIAATQLNKAEQQTYEQLNEKHLQDYQSFFKRVSLKLDGPASQELPTDKRLRAYAEGATDYGLESLYFQFGRYLLISSSRTTEVPANLQGIWNPYMRPPWSSNYTVNINVEENYWLAEVGNLSEMHEPLLSFIENLAQTGAVTAKTFYGVDEGWSVGHNSDIWAMSNPVGDFGKGHPVWANWNMGGAWLSTHLWEHYLFTQDRQFLAEKGYPLMKGAAAFCLNWLVEDGQGHLVTAPATSPENLYKTDQAYTGATLYGASADLAMIRELFAHTIKAATLLNLDADFSAKLQGALIKLYPYQIGSKGHLQEWYYDWEDQDPQHRHQTHLFGLYPGSHIDPSLTPELAAAARKSLEIKGERSTGWSQGWRINLWARLRDSDRSYRMYRQLLSFVDPTGLETNYSNGGGTYPNLLDAHPPFQIDGNFGGAAGVAEMLLQSQSDRIDLLPSLPEQWSSGQFTGLRARGAIQVGLKWKDSMPEEISLLSVNDTTIELSHKQQTRQVKLMAGKPVVINW